MWAPLRLTGAIQQTTNIKALQIAKLLHLDVHVTLNISECMCPKACKESCVLMTPASQGPGHVNCFRRMHLAQPQGWSEHHSQTHIESYLFWLSCLEVVQLVLYFEVTLKDIRLRIYVVSIISIVLAVHKQSCPALSPTQSCSWLDG